MSVSTNSFENYKNTVEASSTGSSWLDNLKGFGVDALGGIDSFMGSDIIKANKLLKSFSNFDLGNIFNSLGDFLKNLAASAFDMLKDMLNDAILSLENASINFVSNLAEDLYNNIRSMLYIPDSAFVLTLKSMYYVGADLAYEDHYIRKAALSRDWEQSLEFIDTCYGITYSLRDYKDLEDDLATCASNSCVNNLYYIFTKMNDQLKTLSTSNSTLATQIDPYTEPIYEYKEVDYDTAKEITSGDLYYSSDNDNTGEKVKLHFDIAADGVNYGNLFIRNHSTSIKYYKYELTDYAGVDNGLYSDYEYATDTTKQDIASKYETYVSNKELISNTKRLMVKYFKNLIVYSYTYLTASSAQKFLSDFSDTLKAKYYGSTDDKYGGAFSFTQNDCLVMMPTYTGNSETKTDKYTQEASAYRQQQYLNNLKTTSEAGAKSSSTTYEGDESGPWAVTSGDTLNTRMANACNSASSKIAEFRKNSIASASSSKSSTYSSNITNGIKSISNNSNDLMSRSGSSSEVSGANSGQLSSMYDRETVKYYELAGSISDSLSQISYLNKDTDYITLRNKNIKQIYAMLANNTLWGNNMMINEYFYERCKIKTMNTLNQSLSKVAGILGSTYAVQALFDLETAVDSSAYVYVKSVENYLLNPKNNSYYGLDTMISQDENNMWTQLGDYFKNEYTWDDSIGSDSKIDKLISDLKTVSSGNSSSTTSSVSEVDSDTSVLSSVNGANRENYEEILELLEENDTASTYVDNVMRFASSLTQIDICNLIKKYLTYFYKFMQARDYTPTTYFSNLVEAMSGIEDISSPDALMSNVLGKTNTKSALADIKFLVSIYALKNSYKYFLTDQTDTNKEALTKLYEMSMSLGCADLQLAGTIAIMNKLDKEQLNSLAKQNFFASIEHLKSINDKTNALIKTAPGYKDALTTAYENRFDPRGIFGYSFENNKVLYVTENSVGDYNSIAVGGTTNGAFFCKSNINSDTNGIYHRAGSSETIDQLEVLDSSEHSITDRNFYAISFTNNDSVYFGLDDYKGTSEVATETLFVYDSSSGKVKGVTGFTDNPKNYDFFAITGKNLIIASSKTNGGCYYMTSSSTTCTKVLSTGGKFKVLTLGDNSCILYPTNNTGTSVVYFSDAGEYLNTCSLPNGVTGVSSAVAISNTATLNLTVTTESSGSSGESGESTTTTVPKGIVLYGALFCTNKGIVHCAESSDYDSTSGTVTGNSNLVLGKTYKVTSSDDTEQMSYIYDNSIIGLNDSSKICYYTYTALTGPTISGAAISSFSDRDYIKIDLNHEVINAQFKTSDITQPDMSIISVNYTDYGIYVLAKRTDDTITTRDLYFVPRSNATYEMQLIRNNIPISVTVNTIFTNNVNQLPIPNVVVFSDKSITFVIVERSTDSSSYSVSFTSTKFEDINTESATEDTLIISQNDCEWENITPYNSNYIYLQYSKYGIIVFKGKESITEIMKYSDVVGGDITKSDIFYDFKIALHNNKYFFINKSSGNKYIKNAYGIFISSDGGVTRQYADSSAFHSGDFGDIAIDEVNNCLYITSYRDKTIFDYDALAETAAFDIDAYISNLSYYELTKMLKGLMNNQSTAMCNSMIDILSEKDENGNFVFPLVDDTSSSSSSTSNSTTTIDDLLEQVIDTSLQSQQASQNAILSSNISSDIMNLRTAQELFGDEDVTSDDFNADATVSFITEYPGYISTVSDDDSSTFSVPITESPVDMNGDGIIDDTDKNWYIKLLNGGDVNTTLGITELLNNYANGVYGNGIGPLVHLQLTFNDKAKMIARFKTSRSEVLLSGKPLSASEVDTTVEGPNSIIDPSTDPTSSNYRWYNGIDFATYEFENSDENGDSEWEQT